MTSETRLQHETRRASIHDWSDYDEFQGWQVLNSEMDELLKAICRKDYSGEHGIMAEATQVKVVADKFYQRFVVQNDKKDTLDITNE